ncbi:ATP-binding cassette, subfamily B [Solimonas aquatica]|uniref:ATP-binding cassette, subfamily B n=1 Tax=Solimonas aquatica TaxID=489703 RepID=A0A1H9BVV0_9GAMM|nr:peptidase domain-containing ABC transporter [Solimonas aquatica]SEP92488.1 ATP-binding cassette, subfamily B [Solimonas aquatica]
MTKPFEASRPAERSTESSALHGLVAIARHLGIDASYNELRRNYALPAGEPETPMLLAIARDLGISARSMRVRFKDLATLSKSMPALIRVTGNAALLVESVGVDPRAGVVAMLRDPTSLDNVRTVVDEAKLSGIWQGEIILFKRRYATTDESRPFSMSWLLGQVLRERRLFIDIGMGAIITTIFALMPPFIFKIVMDRVLVNQSFSTLEVLSGAVIIAMLFEAILMHLRRHLVEVVTARVDGRLNLYVVDKLLKLPMDYFERNPTGMTMSKISRLWQIRSFVTGQLFGTILDTIPLLGLVPVLFVLDYRLASLVFALSIIVFIIVSLFIKPISRRFAFVVKAEQKRGSHLIETLHGMRTIKALTLEGRRRREWDALIAETIEAKFKLGKIASFPHTLSLPFERLIYSGSFCLGAYLALTAPQDLSAGALGAFAMLAMRVGQPLMRIAQLQLELAEARGAVHELATVMNSPPEDTREDSGMRQPIHGAVSFQNIRFRYSADAPYALDNVSFSVPAGTMLGVVGRSGSGKTTVTRLLQRLNATYEGLIKIDGMDLREINLRHLRSNIGIVLQENFLFAGSVRDNISIAKPDASLAEIVHAAQLAGAEEFIERMPRGYETRLEEGAANLSGGQRQRLAIARALLTNPPILLLDEATSALDAESEAIINANLKRIATGRTVISISHRLSTLVDADTILVLERGRFYDMGPHDDLLERCDIYQQLWYQQNRHIERSHKKAPIASIGQG